MPLSDDQFNELLNLAKSSIKPPVPTQRLRTAAQGATLGWSDELEAGVRAAIPGGRGYTDVRDDIRGKIDAYRNDRPLEAFAYEMGGAAAPALATGGSSTPLSLGRLALTGAGIGSVAGAGYSKSDDAAGLALDAAGGATGGALLNPSMAAAGRFVAGRSGAITNWVRSKFGNRPATAVQAELQRLSDATGKTVDEVIDDVANGRIMAENATLLAAVRALRGQGDEAGAFITRQVPLRRDATRAAAGQRIQNDLVGQGGNVRRIFNATDDQLRELEGEAYERVFASVDALDGDTTSILQGIIQRIPSARRALDQIYKQDETLVPLFKTLDDGAIEFARAPNLRDAEIVRRVLDNKATGQFKASQGTMGKVLSDSANSLRSILDTNYPALASTRAAAAQRRSMRDAYEMGRKALGMDADDLGVMLEQMTDPEVVAAFRTGAMQTIRNRMNRSRNLMQRLSDETTQEGRVLRMIYPEDRLDEALNVIDTAGDAQEMFNKVLHNSMTAPTQQAEAAIGSRTSMTEIGQIASGDPSALLGAVQRFIQQSAPKNMPADQRMQIARVLFSENPELVRNALTDPTAAGKLLDKAAQVLARAGVGARRASVIGQSEGAGDFTQSLFGYVERGLNGN